MRILAFLFAAPLFAQNLTYDAADFLKLPDHMYLGEVAGVATTSKGNVLVYTRTGTNATTGRIARFHARRLAPARVRPHRQVRARDRPGRIRIPLRPIGEGATRRTTSGSSIAARTWSSSSLPTAASR